MKISNAILNLILKTWWLRHLLFWVLITIYFSWGWGFGYNVLTLEESFINGIIYLPASFIVVYPLIYFLMPRYLVSQKLFLFFSGFLFLLFLSYQLSEFIQHIDRFKPYLVGFNKRVGQNILPYIMIAGFAASVKLLKYFYFEENRTLTAIQEKNLAELELLKSQIHPHFLFNTLNNLFSHTLRNSPESPKIVVKLSDILRFMIYESKVELISLEQEIQLLTNFINLEKLRYGPELDISCTFSGDLDHKMIAPLLLLPLVENSFKHGTSPQLEQKWISLDLHVKGNTMYFKLSNSIVPDHLYVPEEPKGVSLENVKRRLELIYPGASTLTIREQEDMYLVNLEIRLAESTEPKLNLSLT